MMQKVQVSKPVGTRAKRTPLSLSRPTLEMIVSFRLRSASLRAYSPHALANAVSPPFTSFFAWYLATVSTDSGL